MTGRPGESHHAAKLTAEQVRTIRREAKAGTRQTSLAARYGVSKQQVSRIVAGKRWIFLGD